jgi:hypothetical protein
MLLLPQSFIGIELETVEFKTRIFQNTSPVLCILHVKNDKNYVESMLIEAESVRMFSVCNEIMCGNPFIIVFVIDA